MKDWTDQFCGLWQTQPKDTLLEKAFNELISARGKHCCVCSLGDKDSMFAHFNGQKLKEAHQRLLTKPLHLKHGVMSLKVVVKRALIQLPPSLLVKSEGVRSEEASGHGEDLLTCHTCGVCVHKCKLVLWEEEMVPERVLVCHTQLAMVCWMCVL